MPPSYGVPTGPLILPDQCSKFVSCSQGRSAQGRAAGGGAVPQDVSRARTSTTSAKRTSVFISGSFLHSRSSCGHTGGGRGAGRKAGMARAPAVSRGLCCVEAAWCAKHTRELAAARSARGASCGGRSWAPVHLLDPVDVRHSTAWERETSFRVGLVELTLPAVRSILGNSRDSFLSTR